MEEARQALGDEYGATAQIPSKGKKAMMQTTNLPWNWKMLWAAFFTTFMAEMGDRTQIAMIGQHAVQPILPVIVGSAVAFLQLTLIAILTGHILSGQGLKERTVLLTGATSFLFFALITFKDGLDDIAFWDRPTVA